MVFHAEKQISSSNTHAYGYDYEDFSQIRII